MRRLPFVLLVVSAVIAASPDVVRASDPPDDAARDPASAPPAPTPGPPDVDPGAPTSPDAPVDPGAPAAHTAVAPEPPQRRDELIEVTGAVPRAPGTVSLDARVARDTPGALGEPLRALALLPGVATSVAASGYPIIRGTLPGESRYTYDGIEIPMLYHLLLGNQVIHPSFIGDLELRAGGYGAEQGHLIGGLITMTPSSATADRTELRANPVEVGVYRVKPLGNGSSIAAALRVGTLSLPVKLYDSSMSLYDIDQQTRFVHRLDSGDTLTLTSIGAYDYAVLPPDGSGSTVTDKLGFHRLDLRWTHGRTGRQLRAGVETSLDTLRHITEQESFVSPIPGQGEQQAPTLREGGRSYGVRAYADTNVALSSWLTTRAGVEARHRTLVNGTSPFHLTANGDPFLGLARDVDAEGAWVALDLRLGPVTITPGVRADNYHVDLYGAAVRHGSVDPRLAITAELPGGAVLEVAGGEYTAPPQISIFTSNIVIGPLPMTDGAAASAGMNHAVQTQVSLRTPLPGGLQGNVAAYYRDTDYAVDFGVGDTTFDTFSSGDPCAPQGSGTVVYRDVKARAMGVEAMIRRDLGRSVTGWISYSLAKSERDYGFVTLPGLFDQRHTVNATMQWRRDLWTFGATAHLHTGRPVEVPRLAACANDSVNGIKSLDVLRRVPTNYRLDLRAERALRAGGHDMRLYFELQNASFTTDVLDYTYRASFPFTAASTHVVETTMFLPLPLIGLEVVL